MNQEEPLVVRESRTIVRIGLFVCVMLLGIGSFSIGGQFHFAAIGFMIFILVLMGFLLWIATTLTVFTSTGLHGRSIGKRWDYTWSEVESWGLKYDSNGDYSIWFRTDDAKKRHYIQALGDDTKVKVREHLKQYCGDPQIDG